MEQDKIKPVLEYLAKQWTEQHKSSASTTAKPTQSKQQQQAKQNVEIQDKIEILHFDHTGNLKGRQSLFIFLLHH